MWKSFFLLALILTGSVSAEIKILAFAGSTRVDSCNKKLVREAAEIARQMGATVTVIDLKDYLIPFYDGDLEANQGMPENAKRIRQMMLSSNGIMIAAPEYNGSLSAVLKNLIDWASRSETGAPSRDAFAGKKFAIMSCSPGPSGGARGLTHLRTILGNVGGDVIAKQVAVPNAYTEFNDQGKLEKASIKQELTQEVEQFIQALKKS